MYELITLISEDIVLKKTDDDGKVWWIPMDEANSDYQQYLASLEETA